MSTRRQFLVGAGAALTGMAAAGRASGRLVPSGNPVDPLRIAGSGMDGLEKPLVVSTWNHGVPANAAAFEILSRGGRALDAVETGVRVCEADPSIRSVGYGGLPDREGHVTLDACIMDEKGHAGSVAFLQNIMHPISVARKVMEETPHVMLVGEGARRFAVESGFPEEDLLTESSREAWQQWLQKADYQPWAPQSDPSLQPAHDTISMLAIDRNGNLSGSCTTSGLAFKMHGRVGDSPIIGASLFVDNEVGGACATGVGEEVMKTVGSFLIVELMRQGMTPQAACREGVRRIVARNPKAGELQVGYLAIDRHGRTGAYAIQPGFQFAVQSKSGAELIDAAHWDF